MQRCETCGFCLACGDVDPGQACPMCGRGAQTHFEMDQDPNPFGRTD